MATDDYSAALQTKLKELEVRIAEKRSQVQAAFVVIGELQAQAEHIVELLRAEGIELNGGSLRNITQGSVADAAYEYVSGRRQQAPVHYRDLAEGIMSQGVPIPGKDPVANLLSHISRDQRFVRVGAGTYALAEWGITPAPSTKRHRAKKRRVK
jgi:hypothetical protein